MAPKSHTEHLISLLIGLPQILHGELETSLQRASDDLAFTKSELDKQKALNDKLEIDLLQMDNRQPNGSELRSPLESGTSSKDGLSSLDLGGKKSTNVSRLNLVYFNHDGSYKLWFKSGSPSEDDAYTIPVFGRYVHPAHCHRPARSFPSTEC